MINITEKCEHITFCRDATDVTPELMTVRIFFFKDIFWGFLGLYFQDRTAEEWTGNRGERGRMTCSKGPQVESNLGLLRKDIASVYGAPALLTEPPGAPGYTFFN